MWVGGDGKRAGWWFGGRGLRGEDRSGNTKDGTALGRGGWIWASERLEGGPRRGRGLTRRGRGENLGGGLRKEKSRDNG